MSLMCETRPDPRQPGLRREAGPVPPRVMHVVTRLGFGGLWPGFAEAGNAKLPPGR